MTPELRKALDQVEDALLDPKVGRDLWWVLTALRGPDSDSRVLKDETTAPLRTIAFPRLATNPWNQTGAIFGAPGAFVYPRVVDHFSHHATMAHAALTGGE